MKAYVSDREQLQGLDLAGIRSYLEAKGWRRDESGYERAALWSLEASTGEAYEVLVPTDATVGDFALCVSELLRTLEEVEQRSQLDILRDIMYATADVIRLRRSAESNAVGVIPLVDGAKLMDHSVTLITAAACSAVSPTKVVSARRPAQALEYLQHVKMGQTERGSFVLTIISPLTPLSTPGAHPLLDSVADPFPRRVTKTLAEALDATKTAVIAARSSGQFATFEERVGQGVSANLCEAIAGLLEAAGGGGRIGVEMAWAPTFPAPKPEIRSIEFVQAEVSVLSRAARFLRESLPNEGIAVTGVVINLFRDQDDENGTATIIGAAGRAVRKIVVPLEADDYEIAIDAHKAKRGVYFLADIAKVGRQFRATNISEFRLVE